ncbi:MAG TPA: N-acetyltransferase [Polyangia bacterium]|nr:N-acetyltransferase [Polyangia bacterium]
MTIARATPQVAGAQAEWIAAVEPWRGLGYRAAALGSWLERMSRDGNGGIWVARAGPRAPVSGIVVVQDGVLLGGFVALCAVKASEAGRGIGRALMAAAEARVFAKRRWLYVSADSGNRRALGFYRKLGFARVGRLPDLIKPGRVEVLLRKGADGAAER